MTQASFSLRARNPDVLTCIANLSSDEVFTPPEFVGRMLDSIAKAWSASNDGANIWANQNVTFLDPFTKSGVFLREITSRLVEGLEPQFPDLQERVNHILTKQVFGIAITRLTSLLARRSLYCSKFANGTHSIATSFKSGDGNVWFERMEHTWVGGTEWVLTADENGNEVKKYKNGKCKYCGTSQTILDRGSELESYAYAFIHSDDIKATLNQMFGGSMQFDVVIGNPPYQLDTDGFGKQARPIYQQFVEQAKSLNPRLLSMIIPSRWFTGGMGLDSFRESMLNDDRIRSVSDYLIAAEVFPGTDFKGGICYFLWDRDEPGECEVSSHFKDWPVSTVTRPLLESGADVFIRFNEGVSILRKVIEHEARGSTRIELPNDHQFMNLVSSIGSFGLPSTFRGKDKPSKGDLKVYRNGGVGYISRSEITKEIEVFDKWKIFIGRAAPGNESYPHMVLSTPFIGEPGSISSWTYMYIGPFDTRAEAESAMSYISCRFTRLLISLHKASQDTTKKVYTFVPIQEWNQTWTDKKLYKKYGITADEEAFIERLVKPMDVASGVKAN